MNVNRAQEYEEFWPCRRFPETLIGRADFRFPVVQLLSTESAEGHE